jgi:dihydrofolate reductase
MQQPVRNVIVQEFVSVDGLAADRDGSVDFVPASTAGDQGFGDRQLRFIDSIDTMLLGRRTYELFASYWPNVTEGEDKVFAEKLNHLQKVVFSRTLDQAPWGTFPAGRVVRGNVADEVASLKRAEGKDLVVWGSISIAHTLIDTGLVDEFQLIVCPVVLGEGTRLFREKDRNDFELVEARSFECGSVLLSYRGK